MAAMDADELVAYIRLSFHSDKNGYVFGRTKDLAELVGMSVAKTKRALEGLFEKHLISLSASKIFIFGHEDYILFSESDSKNERKALLPTVACTIQHECNDDGNIIKEVGDYYNKVMLGHSMPQIRAITPKRKSFVRSRIKEYGLEQVYKVIDNAAQSSFLNGGGNQGFVADFEWIMRPNNFIKVLEGKYNGTRKQKTNKEAEQEYYQETANLMQRLNSERKTADNQ